MSSKLSKKCSGDEDLEKDGKDPEEKSGSESGDHDNNIQNSSDKKSSQGVRVRTYMALHCEVWAKVNVMICIKSMS